MCLQIKTEAAPALLLFVTAITLPQWLHMHPGCACTCSAIAAICQLGCSLTWPHAAMPQIHLKSPLPCRPTYLACAQAPHCNCLTWLQAQATFLAWRCEPHLALHVLQFLLQLLHLPLQLLAALPLVHQLSRQSSMLICTDCVLATSTQAAAWPGGLAWNRAVWPCCYLLRLCSMNCL